MDEPTSAIDSRTELVILDALDRLMEGRTTLMIAHRLSTIRRADLILVMNRGELVQAGSHAELIEQEGLYKQLYQIQMGQSRRAPSSGPPPTTAHAWERFESHPEGSIH